MEINEFKNLVRELSEHDQYVENADILDLIPEEHRANYIDAISLGYQMDHSFTALSIAIEISKLLEISVSNVFRSMSHFLYLNKVLKGNRSVSDPVAEIMDVIDASKSYQELSFLRDHIQYRIEAFLKETEKPNSPAFNKSWHAKRCPACGHPNDFFVTACTLCGWEPK